MNLEHNGDDTLFQTRPASTATGSACLIDRQRQESVI